MGNLIEPVIEASNGKLYIHDFTTGKCLARWCPISGEIESKGTVNNLQISYDGILRETKEDWISRCKLRWPNLTYERLETTKLWFIV